MITFLIAARNEYPQLMWTVYSCINDVPDTQDYEVLIMANGNDEKNTEFIDWMSRARLGKSGHLRVEWMEDVGFWRAMRQGFDIAKGDYVSWICGHSAIYKNTIPGMIEHVEEHGGIVHAPMLWMGDWVGTTRIYACANGHETLVGGRAYPRLKGLQGAGCPECKNKEFTFKRREYGIWKLHSYKHPIKRGWSWHRHSDEPYTICGSGGGLSIVKKDEWFKLGGGVEPNMTVVGGGEEYMDLKWWLMGSKVWCDPRGVYYHWAKERGWHFDAYNKINKEDALTNPMSPNIGWNNYIQWNRLIFLWTLGGDEWVQRECGPGLVRYPLWQEYYEKVQDVCKPTRDYVLKHQVYDGLTGLLEAEPWDHPKREGGIDGYYVPRQCLKCEETYSAVDIRCPKCGNPNFKEVR